MIGEIIVEIIKKEVGMVLLEVDVKVFEIEVCGCNFVEGVLCVIIVILDEIM